MYSTSATWDTLIADPESVFETKAVIGGVTYGQEALISLSVSRQVFAGQQPGVGACISAEIELSMLMPSTEIPRMASIDPYVRLVKGLTASEWIPQGKFYLDTREHSQNNDGLPVLKLRGYDAMLMTEADYPETALTWPADDTDVVQEIADAIGVTVDDRTWDVMVHAYQISLPAGYSMREVLGYIAAMYAGNWVMTYDGELLLVAMGALPPETNYLVDEHGSAITFGGDRILV